MTPEQLMRPRYKVIALWPGCCFKVGEIITVNGPSNNFDDYPHLVVEQKWWQRGVAELPEYVNAKKENQTSVFHVEWRECDGEIQVRRVGSTAEGLWHTPNQGQYTSFLPATEAEYLAYKNQVK